MAAAILAATRYVEAGGGGTHHDDNLEQLQVQRLLLLGVGGVQHDVGHQGREADQEGAPLHGTAQHGGDADQEGDAKQSGEQHAWILDLGKVVARDSEDSLVNDKTAD
jgi:hypothetical protein